jgi:alkanesulfonate monooxygenase SsuD/methylene tetrahydromethanopterin reductase-like flavin-dependent oxidoreductase (luciferase family)
MELGFMVEPQVGGTWARLLELTTWAEDQGFAAFARSDHYLDMDRSDHATDAMSTLAGLAIATERIQILPMVSPLTFHPPHRLVKIAATIDEMSSGRFALGVGTGWMESEHQSFGIELPEMRERFSRLFETLSYIRAAFSGDAGFDGRHYHLDAIDVLPRPHSVPIVIGGTGMLKTPSLAGRFADEYNMFAVDHETLERRLAVMRQAAAEAGRDPGSIAVSFACPMTVAADDGAYRALLTERAARSDITPDEYESRIDHRNFVHGTPQQAAEVMHRVSELGVDRLYLQRYCHLDEIDTDLTEAVLAAFRA